MRTSYTVAPALNILDIYNTPYPQPLTGDPLQVAATLLQSDGRTFFDLTGNPVDFFTTGYQVGGFGSGTLVNPVSYEAAARWVSKAFAYARRYPHTRWYVGVWVDEDGNRRLDVSRRIGGTNSAIDAAAINGERFIWDWSQKRAKRVAC